MNACESCDHAADKTLAVANEKSSVDMCYLVVPGWHLTVRLMLARIPIRRNVGVVGTKDHKGFVAILSLLPQRIGPSDVRNSFCEPAPPSNKNGR